MTTSTRLLLGGARRRGDGLLLPVPTCPSGRSGTSSTRAATPPNTDTEGR